MSAKGKEQAPEDKGRDENPQADSAKAGSKRHWTEELLAEKKKIHKFSSEVERSGRLYLRNQNKEFAEVAAREDKFSAYFASMQLPQTVFEDHIAAVYAHIAAEVVSALRSIDIEPTKMYEIGSEYLSLQNAEPEDEIRDRFHALVNDIDYRSISACVYGFAKNNVGLACNPLLLAVFVLLCGDMQSDGKEAIKQAFSKKKKDARKWLGL